MLNSIKQTRLFAIVLLALMLTTSILHAQEQVHVIQPNENLQTIADIYDVSLDDLLQANGIIDPNRIVVGQVVVIPDAMTAMPTTYMVQRGDRLEWIAERYDTTVEALQELNNLATTVVVPGQVLALPPVGGPVMQADTPVVVQPQPVVVQQPTTQTTTTTTQPVAQARVDAVGNILHTVDIGETLGTISRLYNVDPRAVINANNLVNPNLIPAGSTLLIPNANLGTGGPVTTPVITASVPVIVNQPMPQVTYTIRYGDLLELIAQRFGTTVEAIAEANNITDYRSLQPGDVIVIPSANFGVGGPVNVQPINTPITRGTNYVIQLGDNMFGIAARAGVNVYDLAEANGILDLNSIYSGQVLRIP